jgi:competence protein ComEA
MKTLHQFLFALLLSCFTLLAAAQTIDINTATAEELAAALDGVGPAKAAAIVEYRNSQGPFQSVDDLAKVKGIGDKTLEQNRSKLTVGNAAAATPAAATTAQPPAMPAVPPPPGVVPSAVTPPAAKPSN